MDARGVHSFEGESPSDDRTQSVHEGLMPLPRMAHLQSMADYSGEGRGGVSTGKGERLRGEALPAFWSPNLIQNTILNP